MPTADRRRARRVPIELPAAVFSEDGPVEAEVRDVSAAGAQLYVLASRFGLEDRPTLLDAALSVRGVLTPRFVVQLARGQVSEVRRMAGLARLVLPTHAEGRIELGCEFEEPLSPREMERLVAGARALPDTEDVEATTCHAVGTGAAVLPHVVVLTGCGDDDAAPLECCADRLGPDELRIRIAGRSMRTGDATEAAVAFMRQYGSHVTIEIRDGPKPVLAGEAEVIGLEVKLARRDELLVSLAFERTLAPAELARLGVNQRVA